jgi:hypothetical protein
VTQSAKPTKTGERKKHLRTLVESLARWWQSVTGKSIAPYVMAKRRDEDRAIVFGRRGEFLDFARVVLVQLDMFLDSEVVAAVTNAHESQLSRQSAA